MEGRGGLAMGGIEDGLQGINYDPTDKLKPEEKKKRSSQGHRD